MSLAGMAILMLTPGVAALSQNTPIASDIEIITDGPQNTMIWLIVFLVAQVVVLWGVMFSYLHFSAKLNKERHTPVQHWWKRLHARH